MSTTPPRDPTKPEGVPPSWLRWLLAAAVALVTTGVVISLAVTSDDNGNGHKSHSITFKVNEDKGDGKPTTTVVVPATAVQETKAALESDLHDETPPLAQQVAPQQLAQAQEDIAKVKATQDPLPTAGASAGFSGCATRFVNNQSSRGGVRPQLQVLHYTVSPNRPGWSDVNAVVALFDRGSSQASSHFVIDAEGHCAYIVPIEAKAWTQAAGNRIGVSYEVINSGSESAFMATAGYAKLRSVMRQVSARTGIPMRAGSVYPLKSGIVQHKDGGIAWGGHVDITPFSKSQVISLMVAGAPALSRNDPKRYKLNVLTPGERRWATCLLEERRTSARHGGWGKLKPVHLARARGCKGALNKRNVELHKLGITSKADRRQRHAVIHEVV